MIPPDEDGQRSPSNCICSGQHTSHSHYSTLDEVSEEGEDDDQTGTSASRSSSSCSGCSGSSSPSTSSEPNSTIKRKNNRRPSSEVSRDSREPFYLHPKKINEKPFNFNEENRKNEPFYLHDPKSIVYTRVRELFGSGRSKGGYSSDNNSEVTESRSPTSCSEDNEDSPNLSCNSSSYSSSSDGSQSDSERSVESPTNEDDNNNFLRERVIYFFIFQFHFDAQR